ncbi:MAG: hypothetical protein R2698_04475 [Microthrixaceae bacterium]
MNLPEPLPTSRQIGVGNLRMMLRGTVGRCPVCGGGHLHRRWFTLVDRCPQCSLRFERIFGHSIGYIGLNTMVTFTATFFVLLIGSILMIPDIRARPLLIAGLCSSFLLPLLFHPASHTLWTAIDLAMRPLRTGEVDPRYVVVDPEVGDWAEAIRDDE